MFQQLPCGRLMTGFIPVVILSAIVATSRIKNIAI
jgi:hypothetical protein